MRLLFNAGVGGGFSTILTRALNRLLQFFELPAFTAPFVFAALSAALEPIGMPALTFPFVVVSWLFLLQLRIYAPVMLRVVAASMG